MNPSTTKRIGITMRIVKALNYDEPRDALSHDWTQFFNKLNVSPIFIPNKLDNVEIFLKQMKVDGLILSGGDNIGDDKQRDITEKKVITFGIENNIPIFGVCRGMQVINNYFGGTFEIGKDSEHIGKPHMINVTSKGIESNLHTNLFEVNSFHKNLILKNQLGKNLQSFACCTTDGTIEGIIHENLRIIGVMWHPERSHDIINVKILENFFNGEITEF